MTMRTRTIRTRAASEILLVDQYPIFLGDQYPISLGYQYPIFPGDQHPTRSSEPPACPGSCGQLFFHGGRVHAHSISIIVLIIIRTLYGGVDINER